MLRTRTRSVFLRTACAAALLGAIGLAPLGCATAPPSQADSDQRHAGTRDRAYAHLVGRWAGTLEYRNFSGPGGATLAVTLVIARASDGRELVWRHAYTEPDGSVIAATPIRVSIDPAASVYTQREGDEEASFTIDALDVFASEAPEGRMVLRGVAVENEVEVAARITIERAAGTLTIRKDTGADESSLTMRHVYSLRAMPGG